MASIYLLHGALQSINSRGYVGVCYDMYAGNGGLASDFSVRSLALAKSIGLKVVVTVLLSAPLFSNATTAMAAIASRHLDLCYSTLQRQGAGCTPSRRLGGRH